MRTVEYSTVYYRYLKRLLKSVENIPRQDQKIIKDAQNVIELLRNDKPIPDRYKPHPLKNSDLWDIHLLSKTSDVILLYRKYDDPQLGPTLFIKAITNHEGLNSLTAMLLDYGLTEEDLLIDP